jgi:hypothetical protein
MLQIIVGSFRSDDGHAARRSDASLQQTVCRDRRIGALLLARRLLARAGV